MMNICWLFGVYLHTGLRDLLGAVFGANPKIDKINTSSLIDIIFEYGFIKNLFLELENDEDSQFAMDMQLLLLQIFGANDVDTFNEVQNIYVENFNFLNRFSIAFRERKDVLAQLIYRDNAMGIAIGHMPELSYSFLSACDSRFLGKNKCQFNDGSYQVLHLEKPSPFTLYEKNIKKVVFRYENGEMESDYLSAEQFADGSIDIYLPKNGSYEYILETNNGLSLSNVDPIQGISLTRETLSGNTGTIN